MIEVAQKLLFNLIKNDFSFFFLERYLKNLISTILLTNFTKIIVPKTFIFNLSLKSPYSFFKKVNNYRTSSQKMPHFFSTCSSFWLCTSKGSSKIMFLVTFAFFHANLVVGFPQYCAPNRLLCCVIGIHATF